MQVKERTEESVFTETLLSTLKSFRKGEFGVRMRLSRSGIGGEIASTLNESSNRTSDSPKTCSVSAKSSARKGRSVPAPRLEM